MPGITRRVCALTGAALAVGGGAWPGRAAAPSPGCGPVEGVPAGRIAALRRGFNLPGWLEGPGGAPPDPAALRMLRQRGFSHIRLPVKAELYLEAFTPFGAVAAAERALLDAVDQLMRLGYVVSVDMHPGEEIGKLRKTDPERAFGHLDGLWRHLARRLTDRSPDRLFFEILNEPFGRDEWSRMLGLARAVRQIAPAHTLILGPGPDQRIEALEAVTPVPDRNVVYAIHYYDPMAFTHQGQDWAGPDDVLGQLAGVPFPSSLDHPAVRDLRATLQGKGRIAAAAALDKQLAVPWDEARVEAAFGRAAAWASRHRASVIVNEFGALSWKAAPADRARWIATVREAAERHCIGWTHWDYADGFGFMRRRAGRESPDPLILDALIPARS